MKFKLSTLMAVVMMCCLLMGWANTFGYFEPEYTEPFWAGLTGGDNPYGYGKPGTLDDMDAWQTGGLLRGLCCVGAFMFCIGFPLLLKSFMDFTPKDSTP